MNTQKSISELPAISRDIRESVIRSLAEAGSGHLGGSLGLADVFTALYFYILRHDPQKPDWLDRDRLVLSIGHVAPVHYATLAEAGYFPREELKSLRKLGSRLQGHPGRDHHLPGLELSAGSLGQGLSVSVGMALADQYQQKNRRVFSIHGDGELQEGSIWEAAMSAGHHKLDKLISLVDRNQVQIDGFTSDVMDIDPLKDKWRAFGWEVFHCNGHNFEELIAAYQKAMNVSGKPSVIIARTRMGKGVPEIENDYQWHGKPPKPGQVEQFVKALDYDTK